MTDLSTYYTMAEGCIEKLGIDPASTKDAQFPGMYFLRKGSVSVVIEFWHSEKYNNHYCQVRSAVVPMPEPKYLEEMFFELLKLNTELIGIAFNIQEGWVYLKTDREIEDMNASELFNMLTRVGNIADEYDDYLVQKYKIQMDK